MIENETEEQKIIYRELPPVEGGNLLHKAILNDEEITERPVPDWNKLEKVNREYLEVISGVQKAIDQAAKGMTQALAMRQKLYQLAPETDSLFNDSPLRPGSLKLAIKQYMKRAGFDFINAGQATMAEVKLKSLIESEKEATSWLFKLKPKE